MSLILNKKILQILLIVTVILATPPVLCIVLYVVLNFIPFIGTVIWGECYLPAGKALLICNGKVSKLTVFSAKNKPYLPVGPCSFPDHHGKGKIRDFFFVNPRQVIRNCDDKGGNLWYQAGPFLFMLDDFSGENPIRSSYWDEIKCDENSQIISDQNNGWYRFQFRSVDKENILLLIESKHFKQLIETQPRFEKLKSNGIL